MARAQRFAGDELLAIIRAYNLSACGEWRHGLAGGSIVTDESFPGAPHKPEDLAYYGGYLLCESIRRQQAEFIIAAHKAVPAMVEEIELLSEQVSDCWILLDDLARKGVDRAAALLRRQGAPGWTN